MKIGTKAPAFELPSSDGGTVTSASLKGKYVVLYFYPKDDTPGCTRESIAFEAQRPALAELGAVVFGVSRDSLASHCKFRDKYGLGFALLSDPDHTVLEAYGAWGEKTLYGKKSVGVIRSTTVVGPDGKVVAHYPKVKVDGHAEKVVEAIRAHRAG